VIGRKLSVIAVSIVLFQCTASHAQERVKLRISSATKTFGYDRSGLLRKRDSSSGTGSMSSWSSFGPRMWGFKH